VSIRYSTKKIIKRKKREKTCVKNIQPKRKGGDMPLFSTAHIPDVRVKVKQAKNIKKSN